MTYRDANEWADSNPLDIGPDDWVRTSFMDNFSAAYDLMINEELSISQWIADAPKYQQDEWIDDYIRDGTISPAESNAFWDDNTGRMDYNAARTYMQERGWDEFETDAEIDDRVRYDLKKHNKRASDIFSKAGVEGTLGMVLGMGAGLMTDPVVWPSLLVGPIAAVRAIGSTARVAQMAGKSAAIGLAEETVIQVPVYQWKQELGLEYSVGDAMLNIAIVTGASGTLGAFAQGLSNWTRKAVREGLVDETNAKVLNQMVEEAEEAQALPDAINTPARQYFEKAEAIRREVDTAGPMNMDTKPLDDLLEDDALLDAEYRRVVEDKPDMEIPVELKEDIGGALPQVAKPADYIAKQEDIVRKSEEALACMGRATGG